MSSLLGSLLNSLANNGQVHDYAHAAQIFRTNNFSRSPKYKYLFYVNFVLASDVPQYISTSEIGYLVKNVDLPRFTFDVKDLNQYNRHVYIQDRIKYEPVNIVFHDDNSNGLRELWQNYYNYYYADGQYSLTDYNYDDRYQSRRFSSWGLDNGSLTPFFSAIEIYSMFGGQTNKITLMSPIITSFSHDKHDYFETQGIMEATMQLRYNGVTYEDGYTQGIPGFNNSSAYDTNLSDLSGQYSGYFQDPNTGQLVLQPDGFLNPVQTRQSQQGSFGFVDQASQYYPTSNMGLTDFELASINYNNSTQNGNAVFPVADINSPSFSQNPPNIEPFLNPDAASGYINPDTNNTFASTINPYPDGTFESALFNQGYNTTQINSSSEFISTVPTATLNQYGFSNTITAQTLLAQQYIDNPSSVNSIGTVNYGQPSSVPSQIDFTNPISPVNPTYNSQTWQQTLLSQGYSNSEISLAASHISQINIAPGTDVANIAENYIKFSNNAQA